MLEHPITSWENQEAAPFGSSSLFKSLAKVVLSLVAHLIFAQHNDCYMGQDFMSTRTSPVAVVASVRCRLRPLLSLGLGVSS